MRERIDLPTFVSRLTPNVPAAIATIAVRGPRAVEVILGKAALRTQELTVGQVYYGEWELTGSVEIGSTQFGNQANSLREQVVVCRTDAHQVELHCHGGSAVCKAIIESLVELGCEHSDTQTWLEDRRSPLAQMAELDLRAALTDRTAAILLDQWNGALDSAVASILADLRASDVAMAASHLQTVLNNRDIGLHLTQPWRIVLAGPPNVGKSSLLNAISGQSHAIVHHEAGTTRDWLETLTAIDGWPVALTDTAGIRDSEDRIESDGVARARQRAQSADVLLIVVDAAVGWTHGHQELLDEASTPRKLIVWNKIDLEPEPVPMPDCAVETVRTSAQSPQGIDELLLRIANILVPSSPPPATPVAFRKTILLCIQDAFQALKAGNIEAAIRHLEDLPVLGMD